MGWTEEWCAVSGGGQYLAHCRCGVEGTGDQGAVTVGAAFVDKLNLERVFERTKRLEAQLFQRSYVWQFDPNWKALWKSMRF